MVRYATSAAALFLALQTPIVDSFAPSSSQQSSYRSRRRLSVSASSVADANNRGDPIRESAEEIQSQVQKAKDLVRDLSDEEDEHEAKVEAKVAARARAASRARVTTAPARRGGVYDATFPISKPATKSLLNDAISDPLTLIPTSTSATMANIGIGLTLRQLSKEGELSDLALDLDTLQLRDYGEEMLPYDNRPTLQSVEVLDAADVDVAAKKGVVVSGVVRDGLGWEAGVRPGDLLLATSATMGQRMWPKATLDGVRSAVSSRRVMSPTIKLQFQRSSAGEAAKGAIPATAASTSVEEFEMQLARPLGIQVEDTEGGYVQIAAFADTAPANDISNLRVGDRIIAVDSTLGTRMWPVSSVAGLVSACTSRLPGQTVNLRFERLVDADTDAASSSSAAVVPSTSTEEPPVRPPPAAAGSMSKTHQVLLSRCRDVLKRYTAEYGGSNNKPSSASNSASISASADGTTVLVAVADKVLNSLADVSAALDAKTLYLVMNAYLSCRRPDLAIRAFEASVGLAANGSSDPPTHAVIQSKAKENERIIPDLSALNLFTATALLRAHAMGGDGVAARRVLASMEGQGGDFAVDGVEAVPWPRTAANDGDENWVTDTRCYNVALAAAAKTSGDVGLQMAAELFDGMAEPSSSKEGVAAGRPVKDAVSFNTMIGAFAKAGRLEDAFTVFYSMKQSGLRPDKFSYTSLVKASVEAGDVDGGRVILNDMESEGVEADVLSYNTVIKGLCDRYKWYEAKELVTEMEWNGVSPDSYTYGFLMNGLLKAGKPAPALTLFETACSDPRTVGLAQNVPIYTTAVTAASMMGDHARALGLVARMTAAGIQPNMKTFTSLMGGCLSSGKTSYALEIFRKISDPDGYALALGIRAFCDVDDYTSATNLLSEQRDGYHEMSGKQVMASYNYIIRSALEKNNHMVARSALTELLESGYIPSKATFLVISEALDLIPKKGIRRPSITDETKAEAEVTFDFLLFVLDSMDARKLPINGSFYATILFEGARIGGLRKKIASFLAESRSKSDSGKQIDVSEEIRCEEQDRCMGWEDIVRNYADYKDKFGIEIALPTIRVRASDKELRTVLFAEQRVTYGNRRSRTAKAGWKGQQ